MKSIRIRTDFLSVFFVTLTLVQIVFFMVLWREGVEKCHDSDIGGSYVELALRKEIGLLRQAFGKKRLDSIENLDEKIFKKIYLITPTYSRPTQKADLIRMSQTLMLVPDIHWILIEDSETKTTLVKNLLMNSGLVFSHLNIRTPKDLRYDPKDKTPRWKKPRGVLQRNMGIQWLHDNLDSFNYNGAVYFADDDNTYHIDLFEEIRQTKKISVWPVGLSGELLVERPYVKDSKIVGWNSVWNPKRPYPGDMAGFAIDLKLILNNPHAKFKVDVPVGYQESTIIQQLIDIKELEPKADNCTKVLVWHTRTERVNLAGENLLKKRNLNPSNFEIEV